MALTRYLFVLFLTLSCSCSALAAEQEFSLDFVYVTPNTGYAAGGHYGLKLGKYLYHYQFFANGEFLLVRDSWTKFKLIYAELSNRPIQVAAVPVTGTTFQKVERQLTQTLVRQNLELHRRDSLKNGLRIIEQLASGQAELKIAAVGFFDFDSPTSTHGGEPTLRKRIIADLGETAFQEQLARVAQDIAHHEGEEISARWILKLENLLQKRAALQVVESDSGLNGQAVISPLADEPPLSAEALGALAGYRRQVYGSILRLISSDRAGDGAALLVQLARYQVLTLSMEQGKLYSLDPFPGEVLNVTLSKQILESDALQNLYRTQLLDQQNLIEQLRTSPHPELVMNRLEEVRGRMYELQQVFGGSDTIRYDRGKMVPEVAGSVSYTHRLGGKGLEQARNRMSRQLEEAAQQVVDTHEYNLFDHNCVTEMNRQLNSTFSSRDEGERELGGWITPGERFGFSPFIFHALMKKNYNPPVVEEIPSRRLRQLEELQPGSFATWLRESNVLTSTIYTNRQRDTAFLMFTDSNQALRPLFGLINAGYGALYTLSGVATMPFDKGARIEQGGLGVMYSLPELFFINIRKGTYLTPDYSFLEESP